MATITRGSRDEAVEAIKKALDEYERENPGAVVTLYRQNSASVRIRIVDAQFAPLSKGQRHDNVWDLRD